MRRARQKRWNWSLWAGLLLTLAGFMGYPTVFARFPVTRDVPWVSFLLFVLAAGLIPAGLVHAFRRPDLYRGRVFGSVFAVVSLGLVALFFWYVGIVSRQLPASKGAPQVGERAPEFTLPDSGNRPVSLSSLLNTPDPATGKVPRAVLLVFYRGYW